MIWICTWLWPSAATHCCGKTCRRAQERGHDLDLYMALALRSDPLLRQDLQACTGARP